MDIELTPRMVNWIEACGCHLTVATLDGVPNVIMARYASVHGDEVAFALTQEETGEIRLQLMDNPWVAFGVSHVGGIRAAYQFKGTGKLVNSGPIYDGIAREANEALAAKFHAVLVVKLTEVYCTKPGHVAGTRMDTAPEGMEKFEEDLGWQDFAPPKSK
jgi:uncharacterized protein